MLRVSLTNTMSPRSHLCTLLGTQWRRILPRYCAILRCCLFGKGAQEHPCLQSIAITSTTTDLSDVSCTEFARQYHWVIYDIYPPRYCIPVLFHRLTESYALPWLTLMHRPRFWKARSLTLRRASTTSWCVHVSEC